jgi:polysaccharide pyruvyl transferase WcaK-like protein
MKKIGLLDQYTGANLGDAAILEAAIQNVRSRHPEADVYLFSLYPEESERRHGVESFPITGFRLKWYSNFSRGSDEPSRPSPPTPNRVPGGATSAIKRVARRIPLLKMLLRAGRAAVLWLRNAPSNLVAELPPSATSTSPAAPSRGHRARHPSARRTHTPG